MIIGLTSPDRPAQRPTSLDQVEGVGSPSTSTEGRPLTNARSVAHQASVDTLINRIDETNNLHTIWLSASSSLFEPKVLSLFWVEFLCFQKLIRSIFHRSGTNTRVSGSVLLHTVFYTYTNTDDRIRLMSNKRSQEMQVFPAKGERSKPELSKFPSVIDSLTVVKVDGSYENSTRSFSYRFLQLAQLFLTSNFTCLISKSFNVLTLCRVAVEDSPNGPLNLFINRWITNGFN